MVDNKIPIKKQYNSISSVYGKTRCTITTVIMQLRPSGKIRSLVVLRCMEFTFRKVLSKKNKRIGRTIVSNNIENSLSLIIGEGINLGDFEK